MRPSIQNILKVEEKLTNIVKNGLAEPQQKTTDISQFFPNMNTELLTKLTKRLCNEKSISPQKLFDATKQYIQKNSKLLTNMDKNDLVQIVAELAMQTKQPQKEGSYSPFEVYAKNYLQIEQNNIYEVFSEANEEALKPLDIYGDTNKFDKELAKVIDRKNTERKAEIRQKRYLELANKELEVSRNFSSVEELKVAKRQAIEAGLAV